MKNVRLGLLILSLGLSASAMAESSVNLSTLQAEIQSSKNLNKTLDFPAIERKFLAREQTPERKTLTSARDLFVAEKFPQAIAQYDQVSKGSDEWLEVVEEKGWAFHRENDFEKALAQTKTLMNEPFVQIIGSEPFFLQALSQLKICDYAGVLATNKLFKDTQKARVIVLEDLAKNGTNESVDKVVEKVDQFPLTFKQVGTEAKNLPRLFYRDIELQKALFELKAANLAISLGKQTAQMQKVSASAKHRLQDRMKALAVVEVNQNKKMLQKLGLIEIETIERMHADQEMDRKSFHQGQYAQVSDDDLIFSDKGDPWMDELDKYQVKANACPQNVRRKM